MALRPLALLAHPMDWPNDIQPPQGLWALGGERSRLAPRAVLEVFADGREAQPSTVAGAGERRGLPPADLPSGLLEWLHMWV